MSNPRERKVTYECGHSITYDSFYPEPGESATCRACGAATTVRSVDSRMLAVQCPECSNRIIRRLPLLAALTADTSKAKHNVNTQHHAVVVIVGELAEQPCLITRDLVPVDERSRP